MNSQKNIAISSYIEKCLQNKFQKIIKGTDRLCKVVELSMQCCGLIPYDSFETYKKFPQCIISEFERKVDVQNHEFGWVRFRIVFFYIIE